MLGRNTSKAAIFAQFPSCWRLRAIKRVDTLAHNSRHVIPEQCYANDFLLRKIRYPLLLRSRARIG